MSLWMEAVLFVPPRYREKGLADYFRQGSLFTFFPIP